MIDEGPEGPLDLGFPESNDTPMVTVARFLSHIDAQMAVGLLESSGIQCFLLGEHVNSLLGSAFRARLQVEREDAAVARDLLSSHPSDTDPDFDPDLSLDPEPPFRDRI